MNSVLNLFVRQSLPKSLPISVKKRLIQLPRLVLTPLKIVPNAWQQQLLPSILTKLLQQALIEQSLDFLIDKYLAIQVTDVPYCCVITLQANSAGSTLLLAAPEQTPDVVFAADSNSLLRLINRQTDPDTLFFQRKLLVTGDTELGLAIKNMLDDLALSHVPKVIWQMLSGYCQWLDEVESA